MVEDLRAGLAPSITANANRIEESEPLGPLDFYPWHRTSGPKQGGPDADEPGISAQERARRMIYRLAS